MQIDGTRCPCCRVEVLVVATVAQLPTGMPRARQQDSGEARMGCLQQLNIVTRCDIVSSCIPFILEAWHVLLWPFTEDLLDETPTQSYGQLLNPSGLPGSSVGQSQVGIDAAFQVTATYKL